MSSAPPGAIDCLVPTPAYKTIQGNSKPIHCLRPGNTENAASAEIHLHPALPFVVKPHGPASLGARFLLPENEAVSAQPGLPRTT